MISTRFFYMTFKFERQTWEVLLLKKSSLATLNAKIGDLKWDTFFLNRAG